MYWISIHLFIFSDWQWQAWKFWGVTIKSIYWWKPGQWGLLGSGSRDLMDGARDSIATYCFWSPLAKEFALSGIWKCGVCARYIIFTNPSKVPFSCCDQATQVLLMQISKHVFVANATIKMTFRQWMYRVAACICYPKSIDSSGLISSEWCFEWLATRPTPLCLVVLCSYCFLTIFSSWVKHSSFQTKKLSDCFSYQSDQRCPHWCRFSMAKMLDLLVLHAPEDHT